jgi:hypothetical protein
VKALVAVVAVILAWYIGPWLTTVLWFLPVREIAEFLTPTRILSQGLEFYIGFVLWSLLLFALLHGFGLGVVAAAPRRYTTTRPLRALKGLLSEVLLLTFFASLVIVGLLVSGQWNSIVDARMVEAQSVDTDPGAQDARAILGTPAREIAARPWRFLFTALRHLGYIAYPFGGVLYLLFGARVKHRLARVLRPIRRFFELGQMGAGGSGRFAGLIDEWELRYEGPRK